MTSPLAVLAAGIDSYRPFLAPDGELLDPVIGAPTQYGTPYHAWGNAVLAAHDDPARRADRLDAALRGLTAAVRHVADPQLPATWSGFDRATSAALGNGTHRDFFWPPILKTHALLRELGADPAVLDRLWHTITGVDVYASFRSRPPSNWAMVWCSGEWLRLAAGGSPHDVEQFDDWLDVFFAGAAGSGFDFELGLYVERGIPNAYDLFTKVHLADILVNGYTGRHAARAAEFLTNGLRRNLEMQLSDGSVASGYRSAGQTWTIGAQLAYFTHCRTLGLGTPADRDRAAAAADRAMINFAQWQRVDGGYSPVQNRQPGWRRVGYERYTADGHYANLALGFLATAVHAGLPAPEATLPADRTAADRTVPDQTVPDRPVTVRVEGEPTQRATAHLGRISVAVQGRADHVYDGNGLVDVTFGPGRLLQLVSSARHLSGGPWFNPGLGVRGEPGRTPTAVVSGLAQRPTRLAALADRVGLELETVLEPGADHPLVGWTYRLTVALREDGIDVVEATPGHPHHPVLFLPYPRDLGDQITTAVRLTDDGAELELTGPGRAAERLRLTIDAGIEAAVDLSRDYTNRRGECGLLRFDLAGEADVVGWQLTSG